MISRPIIYQNQHNFIAFPSQLCMLLFLETRGTPDFWRLASHNHWHCRGWRCFLRRRRKKKKTTAAQVQEKPHFPEMWLYHFFLKAWFCKLLAAAKQHREPVTSDLLQYQESFTRCWEMSAVSSAVLALSMPALHSWQVELFMEE